MLVFAAGRTIGEISAEVATAADRFKAKVAYQAPPGYHIRTVRCEPLDGRVTFILAANSPAADQLRAEAGQGD